MDFISRLPKAEPHIHLEGAVPWAMMRECAETPLPETPEFWAQDFRYDDFDHFGRMMPLQRPVLNALDRYGEVAAHILQGLAEQNVRYVELSFGLEAIRRNQILMTDVVNAIKKAAPENLTVRVICGFNRQLTHNLDDALVQEALDAPIDGIDLHGKESLTSIRHYAPIFQAARDRGLMTKAHAGEMQDASAIWETCRHLNVRHIQHGVRALEDEALIDYLLREDITLHLCLTSNLKLGVVKRFADHPIKELFRRGVSITVSTDDPTYFGCTMNGELNILVDEMGFTLAEVAAIQKNAFRVAHLSDASRQAAFGEIDALLAEHSAGSANPL